MDAEARLRRALAGAGLRPSLELQRAASEANEAWIGDELVVRINWRGDIGRLRNEAVIAEALPPEAKHPGVLAFGDDGEIEWLVLRRVDGIVLSRAWPEMTTGQRRRAIEQLAEAMHAVHTTEADLETPPGFAPPHTVALDELLELVRSATTPWDTELMAEVAAWIHARHQVLDGTGRGLVHGDPHLENVLWDGERISALLDLEWSHVDVLECDTETLLSFFDHPWFFVAEDYEDRARAVDYADAAAWLRAAMPAWFQHPHRLDRLGLLHISRELSLLGENPPTGPRQPDNPRDRRNHLRGVLDGTSPVLQMAR